MHTLMIEFAPSAGHRDRNGRWPEHARQVGFTIHWYRPDGREGGDAHGIMALPYALEDIPAVIHLLDWMQYDPAFDRQPLDAAQSAALTRCGLAQNGRLVSDPLRVIGRQLYQALFDHPGNGGAVRLLNQYLTTAEDVEHRLVLYFHSNSASPHIMRLIMALPWELLHEDGALSLAERYEHLVILRTYGGRSGARFAAPHHEVPTVLLVLPQRDITAIVRQDEISARPRLTYDGELVWCNMPPPVEGLTPTGLLDVLQRFQPEILHYYGHGDIVGDQFVFWLDTPAGARPYSARLAWLDLQSQPTQLFVCFACHSGTETRLDVDDTRVLLLETSLVSVLAERVPALLVMQVKIPASVASMASAAFYAALARGCSLPAALRQMRRHLLHVTDSWWVPALYLHNPSDSTALYQPAARGQRWRLRGQAPLRPLSRDAVFEQIRSLRGQPVIALIAPHRGAGKTTLLMQLGRQLDDAQAAWIGFRSCREWGASDGSTVIRREIACMVLCQGPAGGARHVMWESAQEQYEEALLSDVGRQVVVLIDDADHLPHEELAGIFPAIAHPQVTFVVTTSSRVIPGATYIELPPISEDEWARLDQRTYEDFESLYQARSAEFLFRIICQALAGTLVPLRITDLHEIARAAEHSVTSDQVERAVDALGRFLISPEEGTYRFASETIARRWCAAHAIYEDRLPRLLRDWQASYEGRIDDYPRALLSLLVSDTCCDFLVPFRSTSDERLSVQPYLTKWRQLANRYYHEDKLKEFETLVRCHCDVPGGQTELECLVLDALYQQRQALHDHASLWDVFLHDRFGVREALPRLRGWLRRHAPGDRRADLMREALRIRENRVGVDRLAAMILAQQASAAFDLRAIVAPVLHDASTALIALNDQLVPNLDAGALAAFGAALALRRFRLSDGVSARLARAWLERLGAADPAAAQPLFLALCTSLGAAERQRFARAILAARPTMGDALRTNNLTPLVHEHILRYCAFAQVEPLPGLRGELLAISRFIGARLAAGTGGQGGEPELLRAWEGLCQALPVTLPTAESCVLAAAGGALFASRVIGVAERLPAAIEADLLTRDVLAIHDPLAATELAALLGRLPGLPRMMSNIVRAKLDTSEIDWIIETLDTARPAMQRAWYAAYRREREPFVASERSGPDPSDLALLIASHYRDLHGVDEIPEHDPQYQLWALRTRDVIRDILTG